MSTEFLLTSLVVVLIPGTGVLYTVSNSIGGGRRSGLFAAIRELVVGPPVVLRWFQRSLGALLIGLAARLALVDR